MKKGTIFLALLTVLTVAAVFFTVRFFQQAEAGKDSIPPTIQVSGGSIRAPLDATDHELTRTVTASDSKDGDLTDRVQVENIHKKAGGAENEFEISFVVFDNDNNMSRTSATLFYTDYHQPIFTQPQPLRISEYISTMFLKRSFMVYDCVDGDLYSAIQMTGIEALESDSLEPGYYDCTVGVTNSLGDSVELPVQVEVYRATYDDAQRPVFMLKDYIIYVERDEPFDYVENIVYLKDMGNTFHLDTEDMVSVYTYKGKITVTQAEYDGKPGSWKHISVVDFTTDADYSVPGIYTGTYTYVSEDSGLEAKSTVTIVVK